MRRLIPLTAAAVAGTLATVILVPAWRHVVPHRRPRPAREDIPDCEAVSFISRDGIRLNGLLFRGREDYPGVVLCHGYFQSMGEPFDIGLALHRAGYNALLFDFRGCGESGGRFTTLGYREAWDVQAAVSFLKLRLPGAAIGVFGISMGASAAIVAAAENPHIEAVVADSPYSHLAGVIRKKVVDFSPYVWLVPFGHVSVRAGQLLSSRRFYTVRPVDCVDLISPRPVLFIYGENESYIPDSQIEELFAAAREPKDLWIVPGSQHAAARHDHPEEYTRRVLDFFDRALLKNEV